MLEVEVSSQWVLSQEDQGRMKLVEESLRISSLVSHFFLHWTCQMTLASSELYLTLSEK